MSNQITEDEALAYFVQSKYWPNTEWSDFVRTLESQGIIITNKTIEIEENKDDVHNQISGKNK